MKYSFGIKFYLNENIDDDRLLDISDEIFEKCPDCTISYCNRYLTISFCIEDNSLLNAVDNAMERLDKVPSIVKIAENDDEELAQILDNYPDVNKGKKLLEEGRNLLKELEDESD